MGKKKPTPESIPPGKNLVRLELDDADHTALRVMAAKANMSMAAYARWIVHSHVQETDR